MNTRRPGAMRSRTESLTDSEIDLYARQIIVPGVGAVGQLRLLSSPVYFPGASTDARLGRRYISAAGIPAAEDVEGATLIIVSLHESEALHGVARSLDSGADSSGDSQLSRMPIVVYGGDYPPWPRVVRGADQLQAAVRAGNTTSRPAPAQLNAAACAAAGTAMALILGWQAPRDGGADEVAPTKSRNRASSRKSSETNG